MRELSHDVFFESGGILKRTISDLYDCNEFLFQKKYLFVTFFRSCMTSPDHCGDIIAFLLSLWSYLDLYKRHVSMPTDCIEKRLKMGNVMILKFETERESHVAIHSKRFQKR